MSLIPDELAEVVHRAATGTAAYPTDLGEVERRWRRRRRRRAVVGTAGVAVLVALSLAAVPVVTARTGPDRTPAVAADKPVQRLVVGGGTWARMAEDVTEGGVVYRRGATEILPDGRVARWPLPALDSVYQVVGLPDDRLAVLESALPRRGGSPRAELTFRLWVVSPTGEVERTVPVGTGSARLVAATPQTAYVWRVEGIVAYTLATGAHRLLVPADRVGANPDSGPASDADVLDDRVAVSGGAPDACRLRVIDLRENRFVDHLVTRRACHGTGIVQLSPGGHLAAVTYNPAIGGQRVAVIDLDTGRPRADVPIEASGGGEVPLPVGLAWQDETRLRVGLVVPPPESDRPSYLEHVARQQVIEVG
ncbi:serine/threonine-protein kinase [Phytohabitans suffuscus]